jgi:hypothetical protein
MPIKENKRNHDFEWEFDPKTSDQTPVTVALRYHQTPEYGPTISMLDENNVPGYSFPAQMFTDVAAEIARIESLHSPNTAKPPTGPIPRIGMPTISGQQPMFKTGAPQQPAMPEVPEMAEPVEDIEVPDEGFESFSAPAKKREKAEDIIAERGSSPEDWKRQREEGAEKASKKRISRASES